LRAGARAPDNWRMRWIAWGSWLVLCLAACERSDEGQALAVCSVLCRCEAPPLPAIQDECTEECVGDIGQFQLPQQCLDCVIGNADRCNNIENLCEDECNIDTEPPPPTGGSGSGSGGGTPVDAGV